MDTRYEFVRDVLASVQDSSVKEVMHWTIEGEDIRFWILCNDVFYWGCSDGEDITPENLPLLRQTIAELEQMDDDMAWRGKFLNVDAWASMLFAARARKERVQSAWYKDIPEVLWPLFDAAGPARPVDFGNPMAHPADNNGVAGKYAYTESKKTLDNGSETCDTD